MMRDRGERPEEQRTEAPSGDSNARSRDDGPPPAKKATPPIDWWKLDDEERAEVLGVLLTWVPELVRRYGLNEDFIPECWYEHEPLIQELLALFQYRNQQQFIPKAAPSAALDFHMQLSYSIQRLRSWNAVTGCTIGRHNAQNIAEWADDSNDKSVVWREFAMSYVHVITGFRLAHSVDAEGRERYETAGKDQAA